MDILRDFQLVIFSPSAIFITFSYKSLAGFLFKLLTLTNFEAAKTGSGVGFLRLTAVWSKHQSPTTVLAQTVTLYDLLILLGSSHSLFKQKS